MKHHTLVNLREMDRILRSVGFKDEIHLLDAPLDYVCQLAREMHDLGVLPDSPPCMGDTIRLELNTGAKFEITATETMVH